MFDSFLDLMKFKPFVFGRKLNAVLEVIHHHPFQCV